MPKNSVNTRGLRFPRLGNEKGFWVNRVTYMDIKTVYNLFTDCWRLYKSFCKPDLTDKDIDDLITQTDNLQKKYDGSVLAHDLVLAVINEIDRQLKGG